RRWFADLEIEGGIKFKDKPENDGSAPLSIGHLACSTLRPDTKGKFDTQKLKPDLLAFLYRAALRGTAPPIMILKPILDRLQTVMAKEGRKALYDQSRFALLKLILNRNRKGNDMEIKPELTADTDDSAYNCGRLLAILAAAQDKAHEFKLEGPGVAERYFGTASVSPASVFPLLLRLNQHHLNKIGKSDRYGGHEQFIRRQIEGILVRLKPTRAGAPPTFPRTLDLQSQGRFAIGFYQQEASDYAARQPKNNSHNPNAESEIK
ncbi:MAG: type I-C CRISPR-associated protein Cas8c/Csd1, partial [Terriglobales bacterium]